jgi:preprotein translocase subunit SecD
VATQTGTPPGRMLAFGLALVAVLFAIMFGTGNTTPQLGLDLRGGTQVTLTPKLIEGSTGKITKKNLDTAVNIIRQRVDGIGVAEAEVATEGNNIVISVPGKGRNEVLDVVGTTALLRFRQVLQVEPVQPVAQPPTAATPSAAATPSGSAKPKATATPKASASAQGRALSHALVTGTSPTPAPTSAPTSTAAPTSTPSAGASASASPGVVAGVVTPPPRYTTLAQAQAAFPKFTCSSEKPDDTSPDYYLLACDKEQASKFILEKAKVNGTDLKGASAGIPQQSIGNEWQVQLQFKGGGTSRWGKLTTDVTKLPDVPSCGPPTGCNAVAVVLDGVVQSYPRIVEPILGGDAQITGNFSEKEASDLANVLKYGALPIQFERQQVVTVSATLGQDQLDAGLLAGAIGLILVILYSLIYYRGLGLVTIASLIIAGALTYSTVVLLGHAISYTLTLAGIAGVIVAIGITADSFIIYFERLRDEVREGRTLRSAVERGWTRAVRTILAADFISLLAAGVLYFLSIGSVRGFAFTLGLSTLIDILVVFVFTKPIVTLMVRSKFFGSGKPWTGLSAHQLGSVKAAVVERERHPRRRPRVGEV